jgi:twitching motility two-component system response regulator PilH
MHTSVSDRRPTVLVVDHNRWERWFMTEALTDHGYDVLGASNGASGLRLAQQHACDVILVDLALPELAGPEFIRQLKETDQTREVPVILLGESAAGFAVGAEGCVPKPLEDRQMRGEIGRVLAPPD